ncbi:MAG: hypothetical protein A3I61_09780 [Acidobacteria bacterium RIFCSPLOWO2_02_FULL_68_18]|nr:MAG: hypothetical protein A3I61_09780 [Acidobacteria bacterium RIFCSPLOWO2_02_FULL_68_18]OFW51005.1 MAG: hypothetical protein A3G77_15380 [Acidobacteria bacterium RIFCSPLOWO2_12_FULL_68_19]
MAVAGPLALTPEIETFRRQFEALSVEADALVAPLDDEQFSWRPAPGAWSVGQCLDHLNATARMYLPVMDEGIAVAIRRGLYGAGPFRYNWVGRLFVYLVQPTTRLRAKAPAQFLPAPARPRHDVMAAFRAYQVQYVDRLRQANGLDLARARVASPAASWLRIPLGSSFELMAAHERRHLVQARRLLDAPGFPRR